MDHVCSLDEFDHEGPATLLPSKDMVVIGM